MDREETVNLMEKISETLKPGEKVSTVFGNDPYDALSIEVREGYNVIDAVRFTRTEVED